MNPDTATKNPGGLISELARVYDQLDLHSLDQLEGLYAPDVYFEDPVHAIQGRKALLEYFHALFTNVSSCQFKFHQMVPVGADLFLSWTMLVHHSRLPGIDPIRVDGASYLKTRDGKIYYHRDYFDLGAMVYENVPVLGAIIRGIKHRLGNQ